MKPFTVHTGKVYPYMENNINTDIILPAQFLKLTDKSGFGKYLFYNLRYKDGDPEVDNPDFLLNSPDYKDSSILVSAHNFGGGSSREHAVWALVDYGFRVVIASSFGDIFFNNSFKNGLLLITLTEDQCQKIANVGPDERVTVDLQRQIVVTPDDVFHFDIAPETKHKMLHGIDDITETLQHVEAIEAYEEKWDPFYA